MEGLAVKGSRTVDRNLLREEQDFDSLLRKRKRKLFTYPSQYATEGAIFSAEHCTSLLRVVEHPLSTGREEVGDASSGSYVVARKRSRSSVLVQQAALAAAPVVVVGGTVVIVALRVFVVA